MCYIHFRLDLQSRTYCLVGGVCAIFTFNLISRKEHIVWWRVCAMLTVNMILLTRVVSAMPPRHLTGIASTMFKVHTGLFGMEVDWLGRRYKCGLVGT